MRLVYLFENAPQVPQAQAAPQANQAKASQNQAQAPQANQAKASKNQAQAPANQASKNPIPGDAPAQDQFHVFDFDDTLGVTTNANGVMLYYNGKPAHKNENDVMNWLKKMGIDKQHLLRGPQGNAVEFVRARGGCVAYVSSAALAAIQKRYIGKQFVTGYEEPKGQGQEILLDFTPSSFVDPKTTAPITSTINKLKNVNAKGGKTMVMTARKTDGQGTSIHGTKVAPTNERDIQGFLSQHNAVPNFGVVGVSGQNKGTAIGSKVSKRPPEEIHFYDDLEKNTSEVESALAGQVPELHIYGPGDFAHNKSNPNKPSKSIKGKTPAKSKKANR